MRLKFMLLLLAVAVQGRPQANLTSSNWKPSENSQIQNLRNETQEIRVNKAAFTSTTNPQNKTAKKDVNVTELFTMDTRTPPRIKLQKKKQEEDRVENSHPGIAVPIDVDTFLETSTLKKAIIYRNENNKPSTTDGGISTWILLSGQSTTSKPKKQPTTVKSTTNSNKTSTEKPPKLTTKLLQFSPKKQKTTTTPASTTPVITTTETPTTIAFTKLTNKQQENNKIMTKIKASVVSNAMNKIKIPVTIAPPTTVSVVTKTSITTKKTTEQPENVTRVTTSKNTEANDLNNLALNPEAKDGSIDLINEKTASTTKRPRRPTNKRKKNNTNKNRRRKPVSASEKIDNINSTKIATKEKPIGTQIYNYLSREVMPTVGVGLVGLVVTAGLASYFLYPFGGLRRAYDAATDRKDYYYDEYTNGGVAEEELIGKVIAGMPEQSDYSNYRTPLGRKDAYKNEVYNYRHSDPYYQYPPPSQHDYQTVSVGSKIGYGRDVIVEHQKESGYTVDDGETDHKKFVVGNVPKDYDQPITPIAVPEHGPRNLRRKRFAQNDEDNEIINYQYKPTSGKIEKPAQLPDDPHVVIATSGQLTTEIVDKSTTVTTEEPIYVEEKPNNFFSFVRNLVELKIRLGIDFLLRSTDSLGNYLRGVQQRVNNVFREDKSRKQQR